MEYPLRDFAVEPHPISGWEITALYLDVPFDRLPHRIILRRFPSRLSACIAHWLLTR